LGVANALTFTRVTLQLLSCIFPILNHITRTKYTHHFYQSVKTR